MPRVNLTPLIDTALTLLVIFMVTTPLIQNSIKVDLPKGAVSEVDPAQHQEWVISIDRQGIFYLDKQPLPLEELLKRITYASEHKSLKGILIRADAHLQFGLISELVDAIKKIEKIEYVAFATEKIAHAA